MKKINKKQLNIINSLGSTIESTFGFKMELKCNNYNAKYVSHINEDLKITIEYLPEFINSGILYTQGWNFQIMSRISGNSWTTSKMTDYKNEQEVINAMMQQPVCVAHSRNSKIEAILN